MPRMLLKLERPLSAGTGNDMHHLHVSEIEVLDVSGAKIELRPHDASPFVKKGYRSEGVFLSYEKAVDGDVLQQHTMILGPACSMAPKTTGWRSRSLNRTAPCVKFIS